MFALLLLGNDYKRFKPSNLLGSEQSDAASSISGVSRLAQVDLNAATREARSFWPLPFARPSISRGVLDVLESVQIAAIGLVILLLTPERLASPAAIARTFALGVVVVALSSMIFRAWQPVGDALTHATASPRRRAVLAALAIGIAFAIVGACRELTGGVGPSPTPLTLWAILCGLTGAALQFASRHQNAVVIIGDAASAASLAQQIESAAPNRRAAVLATLDLAALQQIAAKGQADTVIVAAGASHDTLNAVCRCMADSSIRVRLALHHGPVWNSPFVRLSKGPAAPMPLIDLLPPPLTGWRRLAKRALDVAVVLALIPVYLPLFLIVAAAICLDSPGPALFRQWRYGRYGRQVLIYKFRTMRADAADRTGAARTLARDPRVTRVGRILRRLSIDELPQLLNVLRGDMSLVGPRPHVTQMQVEGISYVDAVETYRARHRMLPGITGWAQVNGSRGEIDTLAKAQRRIELDLWYINNWSPLLDVWIILRTAWGGFATLRAD